MDPVLEHHYNNIKEGKFGLVINLSIPNKLKKNQKTNQTKNQHRTS